MNEKQQILIDTFLVECSEEDRKLYTKIIDFCIQLGYRPKKTKSQTFGLDFYHPIYKETIAKFYPHDFRLKFYANQTYTENFNNSILTVIEEFEGKYTGCYGCGRCQDELAGYTYRYPDGKVVFRCGRELNTIADLTIDDLPEILRLIENQHTYFIIQAKKKAESAF